MKTDVKVNSYGEFIRSFSSEEMHLIVEMKRLFEWAQGDPAFLERLNSGSVSSEDSGRLKKIGVDVDLRDIELIWKSPDCFNGFASRFGEDAPALSDSSSKLLEGYPVLGLWFEYLRRYHRNYSRSLESVPRVPARPAFDAWRMRRIRAVKSELGYYGNRLDHPMFAFELSKGCSVGCWFCAYAAERFQGNLDYGKDAKYFAEIVAACIGMFGKEGTGSALLYSATEPHDNPHYLDFVRDFERLTGSVVCTSTAAVTDHAWIKSLVDHYRDRDQPWPQLSVLSKAALYGVHEAFSPMDMRDVRMLMQMRESPARKVAAGRIFTPLETGAGGIVPQGSISCISGFIVNLVEGSVRLVSPCYTSKKWPKGHRVFDKVYFPKNPEDFAKAVAGLIERNMFDVPPEEEVLAFRDDLRFEAKEGGFDLHSPNQVHHYRAERGILESAAMIAEGRSSYAEIYFRDPVAAISLVAGLFEEGMIDETYGKSREASP